MLNRSSKIQGRPYVRLTFKGDTNLTLSAESVRQKVIGALQQSPWFILVGDVTRSVSSAYATQTSFSVGSVYIDADVRMSASADGQTFDAVLRPIDCAGTDWVGGCVVKLFNAVVVGTTYGPPPAGTKTAQQLAEEAKSPIKQTVTDIVDEVKKPVTEANKTIGLLAWAAIIVGGAYALSVVAPSLKSFAKVVKGGR